MDTVRKTWRERIAEARERWTFTREDIDLWSCGNTCFVGEMRNRYGLLFNLEMTGTGLASLGVSPPDGLQCRILRALSSNDFVQAETLLTHVEDRALELKREAHSDGD